MYQLVNGTSTIQLKIQTQPTNTRIFQTNALILLIPFRTFESLWLCFLCCLVQGQVGEYWGIVFIGLIGSCTQKSQLVPQCSNVGLQLIIHLVQKQSRMSSKIELKPLLSKHHLTSEHTIINHHGHSSYEQEIETNLRVILRRHSYLDKSKVRNLLEELENNLDLAFNILQEEEQSGNKILEEKLVDFKKPHKMSQIQEIHCLKSSFLKLYKKVTDLRKENDQLTKKNQVYKSENERLKITRRLMISQEYNQSCIEENRDVC